MLLYALIILSIMTFELFSAGESTHSLPTCKRNSNDFSVCLKHTLEEVWPRFVKGLPEYDFPSLNPLILKYAPAIFKFGEIHGKLIMTNVSINGLSKLHFSDVRMHFVDNVFRLEINGNLPWLYIEGASDINGTLSVFRITGKGYTNISIHDVRGSLNLTGPVVNDTWIVEHFQIIPSVGKFKMYFDNLVEQSQGFNDLALNFINEYWPVIYRVIFRIVPDIIELPLIDLPNKIFSKIPFSEIFPEN